MIHLHQQYCDVKIAVSIKIPHNFVITFRMLLPDEALRSVHKKGTYKNMETSRLPASLLTSALNLLFESGTRAATL